MLSVVLRPMPPTRATRRHRSSALLVLVVALAVLNPFCCRLLPYFSPDALQTERTVESRDAFCPGKPEAVRVDLTVFAPEIREIAAAGSTRIRSAAGESSRLPSPALRSADPLPRHKLFVTYRV